MTAPPPTPSRSDPVQEVVRLWPAVLKIIREYDEAFPYAAKDGDDEAVTALNRAICALDPPKEKALI